MGASEPSEVTGSMDPDEDKGKEWGVQGGCAYI